jgi:hypothetical protein
MTGVLEGHRPLANGASPAVVSVTGGATALSQSAAKPLNLTVLSTELWLHDERIRVIGLEKGGKKQCPFPNGGRLHWFAFWARFLRDPVWRSLHATR